MTAHLAARRKYEHLLQRAPDSLERAVVAARQRSSKGPDRPVSAHAGRTPSRSDKGVSESLLVQRVWRHVEVTWPSDGARLRIYTDLRKKRWVTQRLQHPRPLLSREVHVAYSAVVEQQAQDVVTEHGGTDHGREVTTSHTVHAMAGVRYPRGVGSAEPVPSWRGALRGGGATTPLPPET